MSNTIRDDIGRGAQLAHLVTYAGPFGFIKPWSAVRDGFIQSQQFLAPSIVEGMRQKLGVRGIVRHRLSYMGMADMQETIQSAGIEIRKTRSKFSIRRSTGILTRRVMVYPTLHLVFATASDADLAAAQTLCLCRNEDIIFPVQRRELEWEEFEELDGFELLFGEGENSIMVGFNRYEDAAPMYGSIHMVGSPVDPHRRVIV